MVGMHTTCPTRCAPSSFLSRFVCTTYHIDHRLNELKLSNYLRCVRYSITRLCGQLSTHACAPRVTHGPISTAVNSTKSFPSGSVKHVPFNSLYRPVVKRYVPAGKSAGIFSTISSAMISPGNQLHVRRVCPARCRHTVPDTTRRDASTVLQQGSSDKNYPRSSQKILLQTAPVTYPSV